jgi:hypothetical protein
MLLQQDAKPKGCLMPLTVWLAPEVFEGLQRLQSKSRGSSTRAAEASETPVVSASPIFGKISFYLHPIRSVLSLALPSSTVCHCILLGASAPPHTSGTMWSTT